MDTFLATVARRILHEHPTDTDRTLVVFNNHRSELFLRRALEQLSTAEGIVFFMPQMQVIDDLVADLGGLRIVPNEFLLFELYSIHQQIGGEERKYRTFEEFMSFGDIMLADFSEIDRYCVDARDLFVNLHSLKAIGEWDIENPTMSAFQRSYLDFYHSLYQYYTMLQQRLAERGEAYGGMAYRRVAENIGTLADGCPYSHIYFVGFNAMSECERMIIAEYVRRGIGTPITDADPYYYADPMQEAGYFLRKHSRQFPQLVPQGPSHYAQGHKSITIVECPEAVLQCKYAGQLLAEHPEWLADAESTAIVLADESLLLPTLGSLPDTEGDYGVNISMGYPYADSGIHLLVQRVLALMRQARADGYYYSSVVELLADYNIGRLLGQKGLRGKATAFMQSENRIRCSAVDVAMLLGGDEKLSFLFAQQVPDVSSTLDALRALASLLLSDGVTENNRKEHQALGGLVEIVDYLCELQQQYGYITSIDTLEKIYQRLAQRHNIAFLGQPLSGLQILGVLETRNLDFRRVVLLSANDGVLPASRKENTLVPYELQRVFHLPTYDEKDAVYAYNFYRLLQRAEEVYICYSTDTDNGNKSEESRFIKQVRSELAVRHAANIAVRDCVIDLGTALHRGTVEPIGRKTSAVMQRLHALAEKGFAPTTLNKYIECPLQYYYTAVLGIDEPESVDESIDASQLGTCVHNVLQSIYTPYIGQPMPAQALRDAIETLPQLLDKAFLSVYRHGRSTEGRNRFLYSVGESQLRHMLQHELALLEQGHRIEVVALEQKLYHRLAEGVMLKGVVDRIDRFDGRLRVIDYKTGSLDAREICATSDNIDGGRVPGKWLQLMCYALLYCRTAPAFADATIEVGIYPLRHLDADVQLAQWDGSARIVVPQLAVFEDMLRQITADILNPDLPFVPHEKPQGCAYCALRGFCAARQ